MEEFFHYPPKVAACCLFHVKSDKFPFLVYFRQMDRQIGIK